MYIPKKPGIYLLLDLNSRRYYIGSSSKDISARIEHHLWSLRNKQHVSKALQQAYDMKHELRCYALMTFETGTPKDEIMEQERKLIYAFQAADPNFGFNTNKATPSFV